MFGLTTLGTFHTAIALVAVVCAAWALVRDKEISAGNRLGQTYLVTTLITAVTGLGIFQHGGFGPPHVLSIMTLVALAVGTVAVVTKVFGAASRYVQVISYSSTVFFHTIPGVTETGTRLPASAPLFSSAEDPTLQMVAAVLLVTFLVLLALQLWWVRGTLRRGVTIGVSGARGAAR